jgi:hypothetical protein
VWAVIVEMSMAILIAAPVNKLIEVACDGFVGGIPSVQLAP